MAIRNPQPSFDADAHAALYTAAKAEARRLRQEAVGEFWDGLGTWCLHEIDRSQRAAERLARRLHHHRLQRAT